MFPDSLNDVCPIQDSFISTIFCKSSSSNYRFANWYFFICNKSDMAFCGGARGWHQSSIGQKSLCSLGLKGYCNYLVATHTDAVLIKSTSQVGSLRLTKTCSFPHIKQQCMQRLWHSVGETAALYGLWLPNEMEHLATSELAVSLWEQTTAKPI